MDFILENIAIGTYEDAIDLRNLRANDITAVLDLTKETSYSLPSSILRLKVPMEDGVPIKEDNLRLAINWLRNCARERKVLVHCVAGISRSPTIVMCYLHEERGMPFDDAYGFIKAKRSQAQPHPVLIESIQTYYEQKTARNHP
ncbi:MAG: dual specificity protein phosphatase family protein [candidate division Zixibacteria bacterium]|nr:dual specificity protein phosphatase family protein [candidate division Zixibacteria bacterium]